MKRLCSALTDSVIGLTVDFRDGDLGVNYR